MGNTGHHDALLSSRCCGRCLRDLGLLGVLDAAVLVLMRVLPTVDLAPVLRLLLRGSCSYLKSGGRPLSKLSVASEGVGLAKVIEDFKGIVVPSGDVVERIAEDGVILAKTNGDHADCKIAREMSSRVSFLESRGRKEFTCSPTGGLNRRRCSVRCRLGGDGDRPCRLCKVFCSLREERGET